jgi:hypothetical protein
MLSYNFNYDMVRAKPFLSSNKQRKPRTLVDVKRQADQKKLKLMEQRYNKLIDVDEIVCCGRNCLERAVPNDEVKQSLRDEYFDLRDDCQRKQWLKDVFLFGFVDEDDYFLKQFNFQGQNLCWNAIKQLTGCSNQLLAAIKGTPLARASVTTGTHGGPDGRTNLWEVGVH